MAEDSIGGREDSMLPVLSLGDSSIALATPNLTLSLEISTSNLNIDPLSSHIIHAVPSSSSSIPTCMSGSFIPVSSGEQVNQHCNINLGSHQHPIYTGSVPHISNNAELERIIFHNQSEKIGESGLYSTESSVQNSRTTSSEPDGITIHQDNSNGQSSQILQNPAQLNQQLRHENKGVHDHSGGKSHSLNHDNIAASESCQTVADAEGKIRNSEHALRPRRNKKYRDSVDIEDEGVKEDSSQSRKRGPKYKNKPQPKVGVSERKDLLTSAGFPNEYECEYCHQTYLSQAMLDSHIKAHDGGKTFPCSEQKCNETFSSLDLLKAHEKSHHTATRFVINPTPACSACGKTFSSRSALLVHRNTHLNIKPFLCNICGRGFSQKPNLERHERNAHTDERPFSCKACGKRFGDKYGLKQHETIHVSVNNFQCGTCGKTFKGRQNLRHHEKTHVSEKPHVCSVCNQSFYQTSALKRHMRTHSGAKPFQCTVCKRAFSDQTSYKNHMYTHSKQKPYCCRVCGKTFIKHIRFKRHEDSHFENGVSDLPSPPKADLLLDSSNNTITQTPVWNTEKETFANGASFIEDVYIPVTQSRDLPPLLDEHQMCVTKDSGRLSFPNIDDSLAYVTQNQSHLEPRLKQEQPSTSCMPVHPVKSDDTSHQVMQTGRLNETDVLASNIVLSICGTSHEILFNHTPSSTVQTLPKTTITPELKAHKVESRSNETIVSVEPLNKSVQNTTHFSPSENLGHVVTAEKQTYKTETTEEMCRQMTQEENTEDQESMQVEVSEQLSTSEMFEDAAEMGLLHTCDRCMQVFSGKSELDTHQLTCDVPKSPEVNDYKCPHCPKIFSSAPDLSTHIGEDHKEELAESKRGKTVRLEQAEYTCLKCPESFASKHELREHSKTHRVKSKPEEKKFLCPKCDQTFMQQIHLQRHLSSVHHTGNSSKMCPECGKLCYDKYALQQHLVSHRTEKKYQCNECGKLFKGSQHLRHHERQHLAVRPYACKRCSKTFYQSSALRRHERTHSGEKPFLCKTCGRAFSDATSHKNHEFTHVEQKPYACSFCGKTFIKNYRFKQHMEGNKCPGKNLPMTQTPCTTTNEISAQYNLNVYPAQPSATHMVQMVAQPVPTAQLQPQQFIQQMDTQQDMTQQTLTVQGGDILWQFEGVRDDQRIMVQPISGTQGGIL